MFDRRWRQENLASLLTLETNRMKPLEMLARRLQARMIQTYATLVLLILVTSLLLRNSNRWYHWHLNSSSAEPFAPTFHMKRSIRLGKRTVGLVWDLWAFTNGSSSADTDTK